MDPRERLRLYLEQRRELGESELVLDGMSVEEVLGILGARPRPAGAPTAPPADAEVAAPADHPRLRGEGEPGVQELPPAPALRPVMEERGGKARELVIEGAETGDWRAALRAAGVETGRVAEGAPNAEEDEMAAKRKRATSGDAADRPSAGRADGSPPGATGATDAAGGQRAGGRYVSGQPFPGLDVPVGLVTGEQAGELAGGPFDDLDTLDAIARTVVKCTRCPLYKTATHGVPGEGNPQADFVVVGEAPGAEEDATGRPFVGASGQLLTKILAAINLAREDVFIANVVKHRPPGNRNPTSDEVEACSPYLVRQLELLRPKVILTVGNFAAQTLLGTKLGISKLRGQVHLYHGVPLVATYHPAALLRNPAWKRPTWEDVQLARRLFDRAASG